MNTKLACALTALAAAALIGSEVLCLLTLFEWALLEQFGFTGDSMKISILTALLPSLAIAVWTARAAYVREREHALNPHGALMD